MYHKGFSAEETRVAWARAAELGADRDDFFGALVGSPRSMDPGDRAR